MNNQIYQKPIIEIDLKEILWDLLAQWKALLIISLIMALLVGGVRYAKDSAAYDAAVKAQKEAEVQKTLSKEERVSSAMEALPEDERVAVEYVVNEKIWVAEQKRYLQDSILMHTDVTNQRVLRLVFAINCENSSDLPVLTDSYRFFSKGEKAAESIKPSIDQNAETRYISELFYSYDEEAGNSLIEGNGASFNVAVILPEDADAEKVAHALEQELVEYSKTIKSKYPHSISLADFGISHFYNAKAALERKNTFEDITDIEDSIKTTENSLTSGQKSVIDAIVAIMQEDEEDEGQLLQGTETNDADPAEVEELAAPGFSIKHMILGFMLGAFLYAGCYVVLIICRGRVSSATGIEGYTKMRLLGEVYYRGERKGLSALFHSDIVDKYRYKRLPDLSEQLRKTEESVEAVCAHAAAEEITMINLTDAETMQSVKEALASISESIGRKGIRNSTLDAASEFDEKELLPVKTAALVIGDDTKMSRLGRIMALCRDYDINLLGSIYISEM